MSSNEPFQGPAQNPRGERELLALPWEEYILVCMAHARPNFKILGVDGLDLIVMSAAWARRFYMAQLGQWEYAS
jgi:hypothetical protein